MTHPITIAARHLTVSDELRRYVIRKMTRLERFVPRSEREQMTISVIFTSGAAKDMSDRTCKVNIQLAHGTVSVSETTINLYAAVDIAEAKIRTQLKRYKGMHGQPRLHQRVLSRLKQRAA